MALPTLLPLRLDGGLDADWAEGVWNGMMQLCCGAATFRACQLCIRLARRRWRVPGSWRQRLAPMQQRRLSFFGLLSLLPLAARAIENPEELPNLLGGTFTDGQKFSTGNTLPLIGRPWGFNHFAPQTNDGKKAWWFSPSSHEFHWMRLTHQPSPWIGDWSWVLFGPQMGGRVDEPVMFFEPLGAKMKPHIFDAVLGPDNTRLQLTPSEHGAVLKVTFPSVNPHKHAKRICFKLPPPDKKHSSGSLHEYSADDMWMEMTSLRAIDVPHDFAFWFRAQVDKSGLQYYGEVPASGRVWRTDKIHCFEFHHRETVVTIWMATSLISSQQALVNLNREVKDRSFEQVEEESRLVWRNLLRRIDVSNPGPLNAQAIQRLTLFYTGLYRALCFPRRIDEVDENGQIVHYSPYAGGKFPGVLVTDNGFWDTFRTVYPLLSLAYPTEAGQIVEGWLNGFKEGGWLPEWASPGYRACMVGTFADVVVVDAVLKDLPGVDHELAWKAIHKDSFQAGGRKGQGGKANFQDYAGKGYIPSERSADSVSGTLDYAYSDFSVSLCAEKLGKSEEAKKLRSRAVQARAHLFDRKTGFMRPKTTHGILNNGDPTQWGGGFVEGSSWHHSFPPFDLLGLATLHGSRQNLVGKIEEMLTAPGTFMPGTYRQTIHEMEEMRALAMGQYAHNNQPVHHILWLLIGLDSGDSGCRADDPLSPREGSQCPRLRGESAIHEVLQRAYSETFYAGDEDNGEQGAWYVLAALGLFEPAPGTLYGYALGSPLFQQVDLYRDPSMTIGKSKPSLTIQSLQAGSISVRHVSQVFLNGQKVGDPGTDTHVGWTVSYEALFKSEGGTLRFLTGHEKITDVAATPSLAVIPVAPIVAEPSGARSLLRGGGDRRSNSGASNSEATSAVSDLQRQLQYEQKSHHERVQQLEHAIEQQRQELERLGRSGKQSVDQAVLDQTREQLKQEQNQMQQLEQQLRQQQDEAKRHQMTAESDMNTSLATTVEVAFLILIMVNALGWFLCTRYRAPPPSRRRRVDRNHHHRKVHAEV